MLYYKANKIKKQYKINNKRDVEYLKDVIHKLGHNVCTYSEEWLKLSLLLTGKNEKAKAITVMDNNGNVTVYYNDKLPKSVQRFALAHEIGHIVLGHLNVYKGNADQERDADKFAKYILSPDDKFNILIALLASLVCLSLIISTVTYILYRPQAFPNNKAYITNSAPAFTEHNEKICYFAKYSTVYHLYRNCFYIRNSKVVYTSTVDKCGLNRLCSACERRQK